MVRLFALDCGVVVHFLRDGQSFRLRVKGELIQLKKEGEI
jgi:hypothetical protein